MFTLALFCGLPLLSRSGLSQATGTEMGFDQLSQKLSLFEVEDKSLVDALSDLSRDKSISLHLGIEEVLRVRISDRVDRSVRFSVRLEQKTVKDILNAFCAADPRYAWSQDEDSINVYPVARRNDPTDLLNYRIEKLGVTDIPNPDQALVPLSKLFPGESIGYFHSGPDDAYDEPWTSTFEHVTVRQLANRISEHIGPRTTWIWQGGQDSRMFEFFDGGFRSISQ